MTENIILFKTVVGSHMWKMNHSESDIDIFKAYVAPTRDFLIGKQHTGSHHSKTDIGDVQSTEIGILIAQLKKNNVNYLVNVFSPKIMYGHAILKQLREISEMNFSKAAYGSINGFASSALHDYEKHISVNEKKALKALNISARIYQFGRTFFEAELVEFKPVHLLEYSEIDNYRNNFQKAFENTKLPNTPQNKKLLEDWIYELRIGLIEDLI